MEEIQKFRLDNCIPQLQRFGKDRYKATVESLLCNQANSNIIKQAATVYLNHEGISIQGVQESHLLKAIRTVIQPSNKVQKSESLQRLGPYQIDDKELISEDVLSIVRSLQEFTNLFISYGGMPINDVQISLDFFLEHKMIIIELTFSELSEFYSLSSYNQRMFLIKRITSEFTIDPMRFIDDQYLQISKYEESIKQRATRNSLNIWVMQQDSSKHAQQMARELSKNCYLNEQNQLNENQIGNEVNPLTVFDKNFQNVNRLYMIQQLANCLPREETQTLESYAGHEDYTRHLEETLNIITLAQDIVKWELIIQQYIQDHQNQKSVIQNIKPEHKQSIHSSVLVNNYYWNLIGLIPKSLEQQKKTRLNNSNEQPYYELQELVDQQFKIEDNKFYYVHEKDNICFLVKQVRQGGIFRYSVGTLAFTSNFQDIGGILGQHIMDETNKTIHQFILDQSLLTAWKNLQISTGVCQKQLNQAVVNILLYFISKSLMSYFARFQGGDPITQYQITIQGDKIKKELLQLNIHKQQQY